jgi:branched-chain amino acid transport system permease protein
MDIVTLGLAIGMGNALLAVGLVLIHKANRVVNLAHGEFGAFCVMMMLSLIRVAHFNYWLALVLSLIATGTLGAIIERTVIARLWRSPRLIVLVATLGIAQLIIALRLAFPQTKTEEGDPILAGTNFPVPFKSPTVLFDRVVLEPQHFMVLIAGPLLALALGAFLRWSPYGVALRASAENSDRARLLGIPVRRVSTIAWVVAAVFAGAGAVLLAPIIGFSPTEAVGLPILMRGLAAAAIARMDSVGTAFGVGLALGVADQLVTFWTGQSGITDVVLLVIIVAVLLGRGVDRRRTLSSEGTSWELAEPLRPLPPEITGHATWQLLRSIAMTLGIAALVTAPMLLAVSPTYFLSTVFLISAVVVSLTVLTGWAGQLSLGQWAIAGAGGVFGAKLVADAGLPYPLAFVFAAATGGVMALALGVPALRLEGTSLAVVTLGFSVAAASWLFDQTWFEPQQFFAPPAYITTDVLYGVCLAFLLAVVVATRRLQRSRIGREIVATRDNPRQAAAFGVSAVRAKLTAFVYSGAVAGGAGFLWIAGVPLAGRPFGPTRSLSVVSAAVIGGLGSVPGAILGAVYIWAVPYFTAGVVSNVSLLATGVGLLALLLFLPGGFARVIGDARDLLARLVTGIDPRPDVVPVSDLASTAAPASERLTRPRRRAPLVAEAVTE